VIEEINELLKFKDGLLKSKDEEIKALKKFIRDKFNINT